jgi:hypothetical protein
MGQFPLAPLGAGGMPKEKAGCKTRLFCQNNSRLSSPASEATSGGVSKALSLANVR